MAATDYITVAAYKAARGIADFSDDGLYATAITIASRVVDNVCGTRFYQDATTTTRTYEGTDHPDVLVDHISTTVGLVVVDWGTTLTLDTDFWLLPENGIGNGGELVAYDTLHRAYDSLWCRNGTRSVSVTAKWGWPSVPTLIVQAVSLLTADLMAGDRTRFGFINVGDVALRARENPQVMCLLEPYTRGRRWGIA